MLQIVPIPVQEMLWVPGPEVSCQYGCCKQPGALPERQATESDRTVILHNGTSSTLDGQDAGNLENDV